MTTKKNNQQAMTTIALVMLLVASAASVMVKNGLGTCLSYGLNQNSTASAGRLVVTAPCDNTDSTQINWVVSPISNSTNGTYTFCINGTNLCSGLQKRLLGSYRINLRLIKKDTTASGQLWSPANSTAQKPLPNNYMNAGTKRCAQAYSAFNYGGVINTVRCRSILAQQWWIIPS